MARRRIASLTADEMHAALGREMQQPLGVTAIRERAPIALPLLLVDVDVEAMQRDDDGQVSVV